MGIDAGHAYGMVHASARGKQFRPQQAQPSGQMAVQWLTWESAKNGCAIRHHVNGRENRIGKLPVDGWCPEARTAYQFQGCLFHGWQDYVHAAGKDTLQHRIPSASR